MSNKPFDPDLKKTITLKEYDTWPYAKHLFDKDTVDAVNAAIAAKRPLLLRGEPGIGKSQLARAVARELRIPFYSYVIDERTERDDILYHYDAVSRLAKAQMSAYMVDKDQNWSEKLSEKHFIRPSVMWWALNEETATAQKKLYLESLNREYKPTEIPYELNSEVCCSSVVLIDEIDKADPSIPNGMLECLGSNGFHITQTGESVASNNGARPLIIITTNEERELPKAFLRRCLVLRFRFDSSKSYEFLHKRTRVYYPEEDELSDEVIKEASDMLVADRKSAEKDGKAIPGASEFIDIMRILVEWHKGDDPEVVKKEQLDSLEEVRKFAFDK